MNHIEIRKRFVSFFEHQGHTLVPPSSVIPVDDPTLLFTNAGMNQFKDVLLGREKRDYKRAISIQPCMRVGGKHNDLDSVGKDGRHNTWFEMLGNWSFGDYYKEEAIAFAWNLVTKEYQVDPSRLHVSVYKDDDESIRIWKRVSALPDSRIVRLGDISVGDEENFWSMGPFGPCGPCTELYFDQGEALGEDAVGGSTDRYLEFWNLVFMEFDRQEDGRLLPLQMKSVDTGMGMERISAILTGKTNIFHTDLFMPIISAIQGLTGRSFEGEDAPPMCVVADHSRALVNELGDHCDFDRAGRGYVLRRILRRAMLYGRKLGMTEPFLHRLVSPVIDCGVYPMSDEKRASIESRILSEEERFLSGLDRGLVYFNRAVQDVRTRQVTTIPGDVTFHLHDSFGFPVDLTRVLAEDEGLMVDMTGFDESMDAQRQRSRDAETFYDRGGWISISELEEQGFVGHNADKETVHLVRYRDHGDGTLDLVLDRTPFYPEGGGELADFGTLDGEGFCAQVTNVKRTDAGLVHSTVVTSGSVTALRESPTLTATVDTERRAAKAAHHTATHLLHAALRKTFGESVRQLGSLVDVDRLRFDCTLGRAMTKQELADMEILINQWIISGADVRQHKDVPLEKAKAMGAMAFFGEKYGEKVRVVEIPGVSIELCGGNHVFNTSAIGSFHFVSEQAVAAGVRRVEAVVALSAVRRSRSAWDLLHGLALELNCPVDQLRGQIGKMSESIRDLRAAMEKLASQAAGDTGIDQLIKSASRISDVDVLIRKIDVTTSEGLKAMIDRLRERMPNGVFVLITQLEDRGVVAVGAGANAISQAGIHAGRIAREIGKQSGANGGGRPNFAEAGFKGIEAEGVQRIAELVVRAILTDAEKGRPPQGASLPLHS